MSFNLGKYIKGSAKDAFSRMSEDVSNQVRDAAINSVTKTFAGALKKIGFSNSITSTLTSRLSDAAQAELAERFFNKANPEINRIPAANGEGVKQNRYKIKSETSTEFSRKVGQSLKGDKDKPWLAYPVERGYYYTKIEFFDYKRPNAHNNAYTDYIDTIYLPLPAGSNLTERTGLKVTSQDLGVGGAVGDMFAKGEKMDSGDVIGAGAPAVERVVQKLGNAAIDGAGDAVKSFLQMAFAYTTNPHTAVMFQGVDLRQHQFAWRLSPETPDESVTAQKIANKLRFNSLPVFFGDTTALFSYPMICKVSFMAGSPGTISGSPECEDKTEILYKTKFCMIREVNINYAPNGVPSFFAGTNAPTSMEIGIQLQEIEYFTAESYRDPDQYGLDLIRRTRSAEKELGEVAKIFDDEAPPPPEEKKTDVSNPLNGPMVKSDFEKWQLEAPEGSTGPPLIIKTPDGRTETVTVVRTPPGKKSIDISYLGPNNVIVRKNLSLEGRGYYAQVDTREDATGKSLGRRILQSKLYPNTDEGRAELVSAMISHGYVK